MVLENSVQTLSSSDTGSAVRVWLRSVWAVAWKDIRITLRYKTWFVASFVWPIIFPFSYIFLGLGLAGPGGEGIESFTAVAGTADFTSFLIVGNLVWMFVNINLWMGGLSLMTDRVRGTFDTHWTMPVSKISLVLGATVASLILNFVPMIVAIGFYNAVGLLHVGGNIIEVIAAIGVVLPFMLGFLICFSAVTIRVREAGMIVQVLRTLFSIFCGLQFPLAILPQWSQSIGRVIPLTHFIQIVRGIVLNGEHLRDHASSLVYVLASGLVLLAAGIGVFELVRRSVRSTGLVTGY
jgi:ABC-2 type transport system permease protein